MSEPKRIQRKRTKGWKMPPNTVYVGRPTKWGNPFRVGSYVGGISGTIQTFAEAIDWYRRYMLNGSGQYLPTSELRGKDLACWCPLDQPCHADVLLEIAKSGRGGR